MILPTKGVSPWKALITVGADIIEFLGEGALSVTGLWRQVRDRRDASTITRISFDWFVLALDMLYAVDTVELTELGLIQRRPT